MDSKINCERLKRLRESHGLSKIEAARRMHLTQSGYLRYESGERTPAFPTLMVMASVLNTSTSYLTDKTDDPSPDYMIVSRDDSPKIFNLMEKMIEMDSGNIDRLMFYIESLRKEQL